MCGLDDRRQRTDPVAHRVFALTIEVPAFWRLQKPSVAERGYARPPAAAMPARTGLLSTSCATPLVLLNLDSLRPGSTSAGWRASGSQPGACLPVIRRDSGRDRATCCATGRSPEVWIASAPRADDRVEGPQEWPGRRPRATQDLGDVIVLAGSSSRRRASSISPLSAPRRSIRSLSRSTVSDRRREGSDPPG